MEIQPNKDLIELLKEIEMFKEFSEEDFSDFASMMQAEKYDSGKDIFKEGDPGGKMLIIASGMVEVQKQRSHGAGRVVIARFERTGVIGEMSLIDKLPRSATVIAVQPTNVFSFSRELFEEMLSTHKDLSIRFLTGLTSLLSIRLRNTSGWFADVF